MNKSLKKIVNLLVQKITRDDSFDRVSYNSDFKTWFDQTEGMVNLEEALLLYDLAKACRNGCIVEVGSYRGRSAVALGRGSLDGYKAPVYAIEPHEEFSGVLGGKYGPPDRGAFYKAMLATSCFHIVRLVNLSSEIVSPGWTKPIGLLFIDGDHSYEGVKRDFDCWVGHLTPNAIIAFDDSTNPAFGCLQFIGELLESGRFEKINQVRNVTVITRKNN
ncbi:MAG: class I SAM-dependent methyltransferase [Anaerolineales bacterium]